MWVVLLCLGISLTVGVVGVFYRGTCGAHVAYVAIACMVCVLVDRRLSFHLVASSIWL